MFCSSLRESQRYNPPDFATSGVSISFITEQDEIENDEEWLNIFPLPSSKYRYSKWYELTDTDITSNMLRNPRIRKGPTGFKADTIWMLEEKEYESNLVEDTFQTKKKRWGKEKKKDYKNKLENWENCECANLSYQDLAHPYQMKEFLRVLRKLIRAENIQLIENSLSDLSSVFFPNCRYLYLQRNCFQNLKKLPTFGNIHHISLQQNNISSLEGLEKLNSSRLKSLMLRENPVALKPDYRKTVFKLLPNLIYLDDLPRLPKDNIDSVIRCRIL